MVGLVNSTLVHRQSKGAADPEKVAHLDSTVHVVNNPTPRHGHKTGADKAAEAADPKSMKKQATSGQQRDEM
ncbi:hypothetical protein DAI22_06g197703 [Oryza sativa Japonica Group]|nr:hypothetical protein DAI22_06g197703 [Oryza sativa Japonica Group]